MEPRISVLEFGASQVEDKNVVSLEKLREHWKALDAGSERGTHGFLYVVEDLSVDLLEALGSRFNIPPDFFLKYLDLPVTLNTDRVARHHRLSQRQIFSAKHYKAGVSVRYDELLVQDAFPTSGISYTWSNVRRKVAPTKPFPEGGLALGILRNASLYTVPVHSGPWCGRHGPCL
jgi:hypothetical protein